MANQEHFGDCLSRLDRRCRLFPQEGAGHTSEVADLSVVHSGPRAASELAVAAQLARWEEFPVEAVLEGVAELQDNDPASPTFGCFRWYAEEPRVADTNAAFFIGLNLLVVAGAFGERLSPRAGQLLRHMFERLDVWFDRAAGHRTFFYPNKFLGDLVCGWLLLEHLGQGQSERSARLAAIMEEAATYWETSGWGWGEHMSDPYATIMIDECSALLLLARHLPDEVRDRYRRLLRMLVGIDDAFAGGPRVPAIRSYAFEHPPHHVPYRATVRSWSGPEDVRLNEGQLVNMQWLLPFRHLFAAKGWHELVGEPRPAGRSVEVPCFGGALARAELEDGFRLGSMSRFPVMDHTEHATWGLSWQSFPVAFSGRGENWGCLRWQAREGGRDRFHPARQKSEGFLRNALTHSVAPPIIGRTFCLQDGANVLALRLMPQLANTWELLADGWDVCRFRGTVEEEVLQENGVSSLRLRLRDGRPLGLHHCRVGPAAGMPRLECAGEFLHWRVSRSEAGLQNEEFTADLWFAGDVQPPHVLAVPTPATFPTKAVWRVEWPGIPGAVLVSPRDPEPLSQTAEQSVLSRR